MLTPREKSHPPEKNSPQRRIEPTLLHQAGQQAQHTTNELFQPLFWGLYTVQCFTVTYPALTDLSGGHGGSEGVDDIQF